MNNSQSSFSLEKLGITTLNEMQQEMLKSAKTNKDIILHAPTGSGKTVAFLLTALEKLNKEQTTVQLLIISPTRELSIQIEDVFKKLSTGFKVNTCYGGHSMRVEENNLSVPPAVLIGTPGRLADHVRRSNIDLSEVHTLILDEFDKSLQMGFESDMTEIIQELKSLRNKYLVSATKLETIPAFTQIKNPVTIDFLVEKSHQINYFGVQMNDSDKLELLLELLCNLPEGKTIIFCNHREPVVEITDFLKENGVIAVAYHGGMEQDDRERALIRFRNGSSNFLVSTDLAARGLDIPAVEHVIHYQLPLKEAEFIHRSGRTGRQDADGVVFMLLDSKKNVPDFIPEHHDYEVIHNEPLPEPPKWKTIYISAGKKDKVNKIDIVGFLHKMGGLKQDEIGLITVMDYSSFAAISSDVAEDVVPELRDQKIKGKKQKIGFAR
ncbi:MAG: box helicase domain protein [Fluviicola sp.]|jgi:ATP-independent RNA helicase DbpA|uniref:DEAD/DEAH box helicase n=1 Tax=Fluviicola sp. TaxID=1917219 RepID=UPI00262678FF|nr:DEAD/DEAH box helicase [Fluviicola sp.]MDF3026244.1 box helicase domain protein [Fluviicola sp.]